MGAPRRVLLAAAISVLSFTVPPTAQALGNRAPAIGSPPGGRTAPGVADKDNVRKNFEVATRMTAIPEFVAALRKGDARTAKRMFVAHGGSDDQVILVPAFTRNPTTGYNVSGPFPAELTNNDPIACQLWTVVPWYWDVNTHSYTGWMYVCWGLGPHGYGWSDK
jgi:hypothetical protein